MDGFGDAWTAGFTDGFEEVEGDGEGLGLGSGVEVGEGELVSPKTFGSSLEGKKIDLNQKPVPNKINTRNPDSDKVNVDGFLKEGLNLTIAPLYTSMGNLRLFS